MSFFGFGKKKTEPEPHKAPAKAPSPEDAAAHLKRAKEQASSVMSRKPKAPVHPGPGTASARLRRLGAAVAPGAGTTAVKRPSIAVQPKKAEVAATPAAPHAGLTPPPADASQRKVRTSTENKLIGQLLIKDSKINQQQLNKALDIRKTKGGVTGQILTQMGVCTKADVAAALKKQRTITTVDPTTLLFDKDALALLPRAFCEKNRLIPFELAGNQLCVAMSNALDTLAKNEVKDLTQMHIKIFDAPFDGIQEAIRKQYAQQAASPAAQTLVDAAKQELKQAPEDIVIELPEEEAKSVPALADLPVIEDIIPIEEEEIPLELSEEDIIPLPETAEAGLPVEEPLVLAAEKKTAQPAELALTLEPLAESAATGHALHGGEIPSVGDLDALDASLVQECARALWSGQGLRAIPLPQALAREILEDGKVNTLNLWMAEHEGKLAVPVCLPL